MDGGALVGKPTPYGRAFALCTTPEANEEGMRNKGKRERKEEEYSKKKRKEKVLSSEKT